MCGEVILQFFLLKLVMHLLARRCTVLFKNKFFLRSPANNVNARVCIYRVANFSNFQVKPNRCKRGKWVCRLTQHLVPYDASSNGPRVAKQINSPINFQWYTLLCIFPGPKNPRSPPAAALLQSENCRAISSKANWPFTMPFLHSSICSKASSLERVIEA